MTVADAPRAACPACKAPGARVALQSKDRLVPGEATFSVVACQDCGLAFTWPREIDFEQHYPSSDYHAYRAGRDSRLNRLRLWLTTHIAYQSIARRKAGVLLDVGCGAGELLLAWRRQGWSVAGVEPSERGAAVAAEKGIEVHHGTLEDAPWAAGSFDAIVLNHSLEHMPDPADALNAARHLLRPGGLLGVSVPNFGSWQRRVFGADWFQLDLPRHLQHFDAGALRRLVEDQGFRVISLRSTSMMAGFPGSLQLVLFGRRVLSGRLGRVVSWLLFPFVVGWDLVASGDCLNLVAERPR